MKCELDWLFGILFSHRNTSHQDCQRKDSIFNHWLTFILISAFHVFDPNFVWEMDTNFHMVNQWFDTKGKQIRQRKKNMVSWAFDAYTEYSFGYTWLISDSLSLHLYLLIRNESQPHICAHIGVHMDTERHSRAATVILDGAQQHDGTHFNQLHSEYITYIYTYVFSCTAIPQRSHVDFLLLFNKPIDLTIADNYGMCMRIMQSSL